MSWITYDIPFCTAFNLRYLSVLHLGYMSHNPHRWHWICEQEITYSFSYAVITDKMTVLYWCNHGNLENWTKQLSCFFVGCQTLSQHGCIIIFPRKMLNPCLPKWLTFASHLWLALVMWLKMSNISNSTVVAFSISKGNII